MDEAVTVWPRIAGDRAISADRHSTVSAGSGNLSRVNVAWGKVTIDCVDPERNAAFWGSLLSLHIRQHHGGWFETEPTANGGPGLNFQPVASRHSGKTPVHLDIWVDDVEAARTRAEKLGALVVGYDPTSEYAALVMTDPEGIEFCLIGSRPG